MNDPLWSAHELARYLDCSHAHAKRLIRAGEIKSVKLGGLRRVHVSAVVDWMNEQAALAEREQDDLS